jgi:hypothetical protein
MGTVHAENLLLLQRQLAEARENLRLIEEREAEYPLSTDIPLLLVKEKRHLLGRIDELKEQLAAQSTRDDLENIPKELLQQFVGDQISPAERLEIFGKHIGLENIRAANYANAQFQAYCNVWKSLQALRLAGNDLWQRANSENLVKFANQLRHTHAAVWEGEIFFEDEDREALLNILDACGQYQIGKFRLTQIRSKDDAEFSIRTLPYRLMRGKSRADIEKELSQIGENFLYKNRYEDLLEEIRISFRKRLSPQ